MAGTLFDEDDGAPLEGAGLLVTDAERPRIPQPWTAQRVGRVAGAASVIGALAGTALALAAGVPLGQPLKAATAMGFGLWQVPFHLPAAPAQAPARRGSFLVIGDWGWDADTHGNIPSNACQQEIANKMAAKFNELGDVKFIINVGDSFYPGGVTCKSDPQWWTKWRNMYNGALRSVPWYSVYGNHDYHKDPCACDPNPQACAQVNANISDLDFFYMPAPNWVKEHPELGLEVIGLDTNHYMWAWDKEAPPAQQRPGDCKWTPCPAKCEALLKMRSENGFRLFRERAAASTARNLVVFSHYPTDYFWQVPDFLAGLSDASRHHVEYFGGHRHNTDQFSTLSTAPNSNWVVGGGGGWSCEKQTVLAPRKQGFVVGEIGMDFTLTTYSVLVDNRICCPLS